MRLLVPAETLVYLETNDLAAALQPIVESKPFREVAKSKPDFSALKGVQLAVAVTGFETTEEKLTDESSVGRVQPRFVAIADTHAWNWQAVAFAETKLGGFVADVYGSEPTLEKSDKSGGKYFVWSARDGRKAYALVIDSLIYFGNDETSIDKCLAIKRNEADSIVKTGKIQPPDPKTLAAGYISTDGVAQIANIAGLRFASESSDESEIQSAVAGILPRLIRNSITEVSWQARRTEEGIEDKFQISMPPDIANVFNETMASSGNAGKSSFQSVPADASTATSYNFKNAHVAWRSLLLVAQKQTDPIVGEAIAVFANFLFEPYGIANPEIFLSAISSSFTTGNSSPDGEKPFVISTVTDVTKVESSLDSDLRRPVGSPEFARLRKSEDGDLAMLYLDATFIGGDAESVERLYADRLNGPESGLSGAIRQTIDPKALTVTVGRDTTTAMQLIDIMAHEGRGDTGVISTYLTETRFTKTGIERRTVSDFGLIGWIIAQLEQN